MRFGCLLAASCCALAYARNIPEALLEGRQGTQDVSSTSTSSGTTSTSTSGSTDTYSPATSPTDSHSATQSQATSSTVSNTLASSQTTSFAPIASTTNVSASSTPTASPSSSPNALPIVPTITPALGLGGVLLMLSGLALCFVGIKHNGLQIFLSTALLLSLAIEVLIIYVMNPPVSDAIQGAYLVAGVIPGLIGGGVAMIFKEMTEGAGCFLGGFTFAMWLLCLAPGGLIGAKVGRIILILIFAIAAWSSNFSRHTRSYGIIICTAFAGGSAFMIGVDCLSKAGLKEFWIYNWDLNDNEFPLGTTTYPVTRSIQVEQACIIVIAALGVLTQFQIWKVIREHRQRNDAERMRDEEHRDQMEAERGQEIEKRNRKERRVWESTYGNQTKDSGTGSFVDSYGKGSTSVREVEIDEHGAKRSGSITSNTYPMVNIRAPSVASVGGKSMDALLDSNRTPASSRPSWKMPRRISKRLSSASANRRSKRSSVADGIWRGSPEDPDAANDEKAGHAAASSEAENGRRSTEGTNAAHLYQNADESDVDSAANDDGESSVAAIAAEDPDFQALSRPASQYFSRPISQQLSRKSSRQSRLDMADEVGAALSAHARNLEAKEENDDDEVVVKHLAPMSIVPDSATTRSPVASARNSTYYDDGTPAEDADITEAAPLTAETLPHKLSRAATSYRTNEWAKEAGRSEEPIQDVQITEAFPEDPVWVDKDDAAVRARAKENNAIPQPEVQPQPLPSAVKDLAGKPHARKPNGKSARDSQRNSHIPSDATVNDAPASEVTTISEARTQNSTRRESSYSEAEVRAVKRRPSTDMAVDSPTQNPVDSPLLETGLKYFALGTEPRKDSAHQGAESSNAPITKTNLLDLRNERLSSRVSTTSFMALDPRTQTPDVLQSPNRGLVSQASDSTLKMRTSEIPASSTPNPLHSTQMPEQFHEQGVLSDDLTLAERKALIQQQYGRPSSAHGSRPSSAYGSRPPSSQSVRAPSQQMFRSPSAASMNQFINNPQAARRTSNPQLISSPSPIRRDSNSQLIGNLSPVRRDSNPQLTSPIGGGVVSPQRLNAASAHIYANQRPRRNSTFDANKQAYMRSQWLTSQVAETDASQTLYNTDSHFAHMHALRQQVAAETKVKEDQARARQEQKDQAMRLGMGSQSHRIALARMQSQANLGPSETGHVYPAAKEKKTNDPAIGAAGNGERRTSLSRTAGRRSSSSKPFGRSESASRQQGQ